MRLFVRAVPAVLIYVLLLVGCGESFRPIITPIPGGGGDPQATKHAVVLSSNGPSAEGATTHVNISGDTNVGQVSVGQDPVHVGLVGGNGSLAYVSNRGSGSGVASVSVYATFTPLPNPPAPPAVITLPVGTAPVFAYSNRATVTYLALSGANTVGITIQGQNTLSNQIPVGTTPVALVGPSDGSKLYVANQGSNNVSVINLSDNTVTTTIGVGSEPSALAISADNKFVYVVNRGSGNVSVIDTATDAVTNTVTVGSNPNFAVFELKQLRVYVTNSGGNSISSINADRNSASFLSVTNIPVGNAPLSLTALADGSRIYVANSGSNSISIVSALSSTVQQTIVVDPLKPVSLRSSPDGTKVVVAAQDTVAPSATHADASAIISIRTSDNTITATIPAPSTPCPSGSGFLGCRMKPIFVAVTP